MYPSGLSWELNCTWCGTPDCDGIQCRPGPNIDKITNISKNIMRNMKKIDKMETRNLQKGEIEIHQYPDNTYEMHWVQKDGTLGFIFGLSYDSALKQAKSLDYKIIRVYLANGMLAETIIKRRVMKTSEKIKDLLDRGMIVEYESDGDPILIIFATESGHCLLYYLECEEYDSCALSIFDNDKHPSIKIYPRKYKKLQEGEEVYNLATKQKEEIVSEEDHVYETDQSYEAHISQLAPTWYKEEKVELTMDEIAEKFNLDVESIRIKKED